LNRRRRDGPVLRDFLLTLLIVYWATGTIMSSMRGYRTTGGTRWSSARPPGYGRRPGSRCPPNEYLPQGVPPREWAERLYRVVRWTPMPPGGSRFRARSY
jgi:hypothetical protein